MFQKKAPIGAEPVPGEEGVAPIAEVKKPMKKKKKKGKKGKGHDKGNTQFQAKGKGPMVDNAFPGKGKRPVPPQFAKGKKSEKSMSAKPVSSRGSIAEDIFG